MIRYTLIQSDIRYLARKKGEHQDTFSTRKDVNNPIFVDVHDIDGENARLVLHYANGNIVEGWTWHWVCLRPVEIHGVDELFDGRFNSDKDVQ